MNEPRKANYSSDRGTIRVQCPVCGAGGGHPLNSYQPKCHICTDKVLMLPASNDECVCTWEEAVNYFLSNRSKVNL